jgi:hypothetical protein
MQLPRFKKQLEAMAEHSQGQENGDKWNIAKNWSLHRRFYYHPAIGKDERRNQRNETETSVERKLGSSGRDERHRVDEENDRDHDQGNDVDGVHDQPRHQQPSSAACTPEM